MPAQAILTQVHYERAYDGTADFDTGKPDAPGLDSGPQNNIARTHDEVGYSITLSTTGEDENPTIRLTMPTSAGTNVAAWNALPTFCQAGSSRSADGQSIVCLLEDFSASATRTVTFPATILPSARNGDLLPAPTLSVSSAKVPQGLQPPNTPETIRVSAAPFYDVKIELSHNGSPRAFSPQAGSGPNGENGVYHRPLIGLIARNPNGPRHGKKGVEQLDPNLPIEIDLNMQVTGLDEQVPIIDWDKDARGSYTDGCGSATPGSEQRPGVLSGNRINTYGRVTDRGPLSATDAFTVANGGDCRVVSQGNAGNQSQYTIAIDRPDTSLGASPANPLGSTPTQVSRTLTKIPDDEFWVANKGLVLWTPMRAYPSGVRIDHVFSATAIRGTSISGQSISGDRLTNNSITYFLISQNNGTAQKTYSPDTTLPAPYATRRDPVYTGDSIVNYMAPEQTVTATLRHTNTGTVEHGSVTLCDILDRSAFDLAPHFSATIHTGSLNDAGAVVKIQYGAPPAGQSPYFASTDSAPSPHEQAGAASVVGTSAYARASCKTAGIRWFDTYQQAEAAGGLVYVRAQVNRVLPSASALFYIKGLKLRKTWAATVTVETPHSQIRRQGTEIEEGSLLRNRAEIESVDFKHTNPHFRDHLEVVHSQTVSSLRKEIIDPVTGSTAPIDAGKMLTYRLTPFYSTQFPPQADTVTVTDILPEGTTYLKGRSKVDGQPVEPEVQLDTPAKGQTTLTWRFPNRTPHLGEHTDTGAALPIIEFDVELSPFLEDDHIIRNLARVGDSRYNQEKHCEYDATLNAFVLSRDDVANATSTCTRSASAEIRIKSQPNMALQKLASSEMIEPGDAFHYRLRIVAIGQTLRTPDVPDLIDILPFAGDGEDRFGSHSFSARSPASVLDARAYRLVSVTPPSLDPNARIYYTNRAPQDIHNDPQHVSNLIPGGETRWCLATEFGTPGCPADIGESTAVRTSPAIAELGAARPYEVQLNLVSDPVRAVDGDIFANHAMMQPADPNSTLLMVESPAGLYVRVSTNAGGISGQVFSDVGRDGKMQALDWALPNQCVQVTGSTVKGHPITVSMRTDDQGRYSFTKGQANEVFVSADCSGSPLPVFGGLMAGEYTVSRTGNSQQAAGGVYAGSEGGTVDAQSIRITLAEGALGTGYDFTDHPALPRLTLISTVINDQGGTATVSQTNLSARQDGTQSLLVDGRGGSSDVNDIGVPAGTYQLSGGVLNGYLRGSWACTLNGNPITLAPGEASAGGEADAVLTLTYGDVAVCSVVYDDQPARLTLMKTVTNSNGRTAGPTDFQLYADGPTPLAGTTGSAEVTAVDVMPGSYTLREDNLPNYVAGAWQCDAGELRDDTLTLGNGVHATCTINNTDQPVSLTLVLDILNEHGGTARPSDVPLEARGPDHVQGISGTKPVTVAPVRPGVYDLGNPALPGYRTGKWACSGGTLDGNVLTLSDQQNVTCRIELKDIPAELKATKTVLGTPQAAEGSESDYWVGYELKVQHTSGADGLYDLTDTPAFDADVQIIDTRITRNGDPLSLAANDGRWPLASRQHLAIGGEDVYQMQFRIRVPYGSSTDNNSCDAGTEGQGLYNRLSLINRSADESEGATATSSACIDTPVPVSKAALSIEKTSTSHSAEVGDLITYQVRIRNNGNGPAISPMLVDRLPRGFRFEPNSLRIKGARQVNAQFNGQRELRLTLDRIDVPGAIDGSNGEVIISYRARLGVGSQQGDGTNRAHVECLNVDGSATARCSNEARWKVRVQGGVFSEEVCLAGQIFVDCNGNSVKDPEELGIPGVRFYLQNGTWIVSDEQGKYSHCGLRPRTHVLKVDARTLPRRARLVTSNAQNAGDAESLFIDARKGMLHRADFIEGSCSASVIEQVKARQAQGVDIGVQTEHGQPSLTFDSKRGAAARPTREGTDDARQSRLRTRH
ncbi:MAG: hypothetical protein Q4A16_02575 [Lautropia sp.]|nr:hypothetical protein [Lautropia sp.]